MFYISPFGLKTDKQKDNCLSQKSKMTLEIKGCIFLYDLVSCAEHLQGFGLEARNRPGIYFRQVAQRENLVILNFTLSFRLRYELSYATIMNSKLYEKN